MACPYFWPVERRAGSYNWREAMMPLGGVWAGNCLATRDASWTPDDGRLRPFCNLGYARGGCDRFPAANAADAVRFTITGDDGSTVRLYYVVEQNHHPQAHG